MELRGFENYLELSKNLSSKSIKNKINSINWLTNTCRLDLNKAISSPEDMIVSRKKIYKLSANIHLAEKRYNALRAYYEFINGAEAPTLKEFCLNNNIIDK